MMENLNICDELFSIEEIRNNILNRYGLSNSNITMVKFKDTDKQRAVYRVESNYSCYCLKKVYYNEENLLFVYSAMEWLYKNNVMVPKLLKTLDNNRYIKYKNMLFILTLWVDGDKCDFDNIEHITLSSKTLGKLHKVSTSFKPITGSVNRISCDDYGESVYKHFNQMLNTINIAQKYKDRFSNIFLENIESHLELAKISLEFSSSIDVNNLSCSLCHGDYVNKNIIISEDKTVWVIDFDKCRYDYCARDFSYFLRRLLKRESTNWEKDITLKALDNYLEVKELTADDFKYIISYVAFPQKFWKISRDYYKNIKKCNKSSFILLLQKGIERSDNQLEYTKDLIETISNRYNVEI